uniref:Serine-rich adhesin for platelets n=1 Tax=Macrostomum lignano TaxID=282301 RepID=A0A1I8FG07_9PLAT
MKSQQAAQRHPVAGGHLSSAVSQPTLSSRSESRPIDGHKFVEGQRFGSRLSRHRQLGAGTPPHDLPLTDRTPQVTSCRTACFENCGKPLWQASLACTTAQQTCGTQRCWMHSNCQSAERPGRRRFTSSTPSTRAPHSHERSFLLSVQEYEVQVCSCSLRGLPQTSTTTSTTTLLQLQLGPLTTSTTTTSTASESLYNPSGETSTREEVRPVTKTTATSTKASCTDKSNETPKRPLHQCWHQDALASIMDNSGGPAKSNGYPNRKQAPANYNQPQRQQASNRRLRSGVSEANLDSSYYSQGEASDGRDADYRLQTHFDAADFGVYPMVRRVAARVLVVAAVAVFSTETHLTGTPFTNVRASRQRPAIPVDLLMRGNGAESGGGGGAQLSREEIQEQVEKQRREIDNVYASCVRRLSAAAQPFASSQQELHRSVRRNENAHRGIRSDNTGRCSMGIHPMEAQASHQGIFSQRRRLFRHRLETSSSWPSSSRSKRGEVDEEPYVTESQESVAVSCPRSRQLKSGGAAPSEKDVRVWEAVPARLSWGNQR